jgi:hydroxyacylglutathione hydrolase
MYIEQIYTSCLAQASYYLESDGEAAVIDPMRDIDQYVAIAEKRKAKIKYVFLTHFHADFVSGHLDLAEKTNSTIVLGPQAKPLYKALIAEDNYHFYLGNTKIKILHTPGHTIESSCFLAFDENKQPYALFSGDTLFIGDVGRPDLLSGNLKKEELAAMLFDSINNKIRPLPDNVVIYPGHGAGSACGKNLSSESISTIGEQKKNNYALSDIGKEKFIEFVTTDQPNAPAYFFKDAAINIKGYNNLDNILLHSLKPLSAEDIKKEKDHGAVILDTRNFNEFKNFIKDSLLIGLDGQFAVWCGTLLDFDKPTIIVCDPGKEKEVIIRLARIGFENVIGYFNSTIENWAKTGGAIDFIKSIDMCPEVKDKLNDETLSILDVRKKTEASAEKISNGRLIPLDELYNHINSINKKNKLMVYCVGGYRSVIAISILKRNGFENIINLKGGINKLKTSCPELIEYV